MYKVYTTDNLFVLRVTHACCGSVSDRSRLQHAVACRRTDSNVETRPLRRHLWTSNHNAAPDCYRGGCTAVYSRLPLQTAHATKPACERTLCAAVLMTCSALRCVQLHGSPRNTNTRQTAHAKHRSRHATARCAHCHLRRRSSNLHVVFRFTLTFTTTAQRCTATAMCCEREQAIVSSSRYVASVGWKKLTCFHLLHAAFGLDCRKRVVRAPFALRPSCVHALSSSTCLRVHARPTTTADSLLLTVSECPPAFDVTTARASGPQPLP